MSARPFRLLPTNPLETDRQSAIVRYLRFEPQVKFVIRLNGGGRRLAGAFVWFYRLFVSGREEQKGKGVSDLIGQLQDGRFFAFEVKRPGEQPSEEQAAFLALVRAGGGVSGVVERWEEARSIIYEARQ